MYSLSQERDYTKGFEAGVDVVLSEVEKFIQRYDYERRITRPIEMLLEHLKKEMQVVDKKTTLEK